MYCEPLTSNPENERLIKSFVIDREIEYRQYYEKTGRIIGLEQYLKHCAWDDDLTNETRVYVIKTYFTHEIIAYFAIKAGMISVDSQYRNKDKEAQAKNQGIKLVPNTISGVEISHFAVNDEYRRNHSRNGSKITGLGAYLFPAFIFPIIKKVSTDIGIKIMYLYAADDTSKDSNAKNTLINYYKKVFEFNTVSESDEYKPVTSYYDNGCIFMYRML